jgi:NAD(P)-dependent dehydrogenase (short-subunit alcohol dehydrogenase family)
VSPFSTALSGRRILITGAGSGIGEALALGLAKAGAQIIVTDVDPRACEAVAARIGQAGGQAQAYALDVSDAEACARLAARVHNDLGDLDAVVNNAGVALRDDLDAADFLSKWKRTFEINVDGTMHVILAFLDQLRRQRGAIVNIASTTSFVAAQGSVAYTASKGAVSQLTKALARDLAPDGIRVNAIAPGMVATPLTSGSRSNPERMGVHLARSMMHRVGEPHEIVGPVALLISDAASYMTGAIIPVDGGYLAR